MIFLRLTSWLNFIDIDQLCPFHGHHQGDDQICAAAFWQDLASQMLRAVWAMVDQELLATTPGGLLTA